MKKTSINLLVLAALILGLVMSAQPALALSLPSGTTIDSATLLIYVARVSNETVNVHRITADWTETGVTWNNFGSAYDPSVVGSFAADSAGWKSVDITSLVQGWVDGTYPNFGVLLEQEQNPYTTYLSSDYDTHQYRPKFMVCYGEGPTCVTIQKGVTEDVVDASIWELNPDENRGSFAYLFTGLADGYEKQSLLRFDLDLTSNGEGCTPGFWRQEQHFDSWTGYSPDSLYNPTFGIDDGSFETLLDAVWARGGQENALARHAVAALLNAASPDVEYAYSEAEVRQMVQDAYESGDFEFFKDQFEYENELGCPLD